MNAPTLERLADLIVGMGANVQEGQIVAISTAPVVKVAKMSTSSPIVLILVALLDAVWMPPPRRLDEAERKIIFVLRCRKPRA